MVANQSTIYRYAPGHPNATPSGNIRDYRWRAAELLGRVLSPAIVIHHHSPRQLVICQDENYHKLLHVRIRAYQACSDPHKRKCSFCKKYDDPKNLVSTLSKGGRYHYHYSCCNGYRKKKGYGKKKGGGIEET